jgi:peptide/nickel transport system substrate-binding protein
VPDARSKDGSRWRSGVLVGMAVAVAFSLTAAGCGGSTNKTDADQASTTTTAVVTNMGGSRSGPPDAGAAQNGGAVVMGIEAEPEGIDPTHYVMSESGNSVASAVFDTLTTIDAEGKTVPHLAKSVDGSDGNKTWTITLPTNVKFHDGTPLTAKVVVANFEAYRESYVTKLALQTVTTIEATDDTHVVIKLSGPWAEFPLALTSQLGYILAPAMLADPVAAKDHPIGTGAFIFESHVPNEVWKFKKNPTYWRSPLPHLDNISFKPIPDNAARVKALHDGTVDVIHAYQAEAVTQLRTEDSIKRVENNKGAEDFLLLNTEKAPFDKIEARLAVAYATNSAGWRHELQSDVVQPANGPFAPGQLGYVEDNGFPTFDLTKAKEQVAKYKSATGKDIEFSLIVTNELYSQKEAQYFMDSYTAAGMKVTLVQQAQIQLIASAATGAYEMVRFRNFSFPNPDVDTVFWRSTSIVAAGVSLNFPRYVNPKVDELINKALASSDSVERDQAYQEISKIWAKDLPYIWLGRPIWVLAANAKVNGIDPATNGTIGTIGVKTWIADLWVSK